MAPPFSVFMCDGGRPPLPLPPCTADGDAGTVVAVASGSFHACALFSGGTVKCWGDNSQGQLGVGNGCLDLSPTPLPVHDVCGATAISAAQYHTCVVLRDGSVACWGTTPDSVENTSTPLSVDAGLDADCDASDNDNFVGSAPGLVPCVASAVTVAAGEGLDCAVIADGTVRCWGYGIGGGLGNGNVNGPVEAQTGGDVGPVEVSNIHDAVAVSVSESACALLADMTVKCWGPNTSGELGDGTTLSSPVPVVVQNLSSASAVTIGGPNGSNDGCGSCAGYTCAALSNGTVECWGQDEYGELGNGMTAVDAGTTPGPVPGLTGVVSVVASEGDVFAVLADGTAMGWGENQCGELGNGMMGVATTPTVVQSLDHVTSISPGSCHACALLSDGRVECWGDDTRGQLGAGPDGPPSSLTPVKVQL